MRSSCSRCRRSYQLRLTLGAISSVCVIRTLVILPGDQLALPALSLLPYPLAHAACGDALLLSNLCVGIAQQHCLGIVLPCAQRCPVRSTLNTDKGTRGILLRALEDTPVVRDHLVPCIVNEC